MECKDGTNTHCLTGICQCYPGYMPRPRKGNNANDQPVDCIAEPSCASLKNNGGIRIIEGGYTDCSDDKDVCEESEYCRPWWFDNQVKQSGIYALCCPKAS